MRDSMHFVFWQTLSKVQMDKLNHTGFEGHARQLTHPGGLAGGGGRMASRGSD